MQFCRRETNGEWEFMKIGFFSDLHYGREEKRGLDRYPSRSLGKLRCIISDMKDAGVSLAVFCGDLVSGLGDKNDDLVCAASAAGMMLQCGIPVVSLRGNHDYYQMGSEEYYSITGFTPPPFTLRADGVTLVFLDANYSSDGVRYFTDGVRPDWKDSFIPSEQLERLIELLGNAAEGERFWIVCHQCLDIGVDERYIIKNVDEVLQTVERYGVGKVERVINGHFHRGGYSIDGGIEFFTLNAVCSGTEYDSSCLLILDTEKSREEGIRI